MIPLRTRSDLIELAARNAPTAAVRRSLLERGAQVFRVLNGPAGFPGWVVRSTAGRLIGIWADEAHLKYRVDYPDAVPAGAEEMRGIWI